MNSDRTGLTTEWMIGAFLIIVVFASFANTLSGDFVWDDRTLFVEYGGVWRWENLKTLLTTQDNLFRYNDTGFYRPLPNLTFLIDATVWGLSPSGFHLTNILLHGLSTIAVFRIGLRLIADTWPAGAAALLFALHPVHTEAVSFITGRNNLLCITAFLWAFHFFTRWRSTGGRRDLLIAVLLLTAAVFSKEYAFAFPLIIFLYEAAFSHRERPASCRLVNALIRCLPFILPLAVYLTVRFAVGITAGIDPAWNSLPQRLLSIPDIVAAYLKLLLFPVNLAPFHAMTHAGDVSDRSWWIILIGLCGAFALWLIAYRHCPVLFFLLGWIALTLLPVLNIVPIPYAADLISERHLYLPSVGFCLICAWVARQLSGRIAPSAAQMVTARATVALILLAGTAVAYAIGTVERNRAWQSELTLWQAAAATAADDYRARTNYAIALAVSGRMAPALTEALAAVQLNPEAVTPYFILGTIQLEMGKTSAARASLERVVSLDPAHEDAIKLLAHIRQMAPAP